jgi:phage baseplate assembly protein W
MTEIATTYTNYQLSSIGVGAIATGISDIRQCIDFILRTIPGSDPLRPLFGSDVFDYVDKPTNVAIPNIKRAIFEAVSLWETRIQIVSIVHETRESQLFFSITFTTLDSDLLNTLIWSQAGVLSDSSPQVSGIILSALIPGKVPTGRYSVFFIVDDSQAYPAPPSYGFDTPTELLAWVKENYFGYGQWYLTAGKLVLYLKPGVAKKATLVVSQSAIITRASYIRSLSPGEFYKLSLAVDGLNATPLFPENTFNTAEQLLFWVQTTWAFFGTWSIKNSGAVITTGDFDVDFNTDFDKGGVHVERYLFFQTDKYTSAILTVS